MIDCDPSTLDALADPSQFTEPIDLQRYDVDIEVAAKALEQMLVIRCVEELIGDLVSEGSVRCPCHLAIGQEACAVGAALVVDPTIDRVFGAHRSHGHYLALGGDVYQLFSEVLGRVTGCARGMGGSMHLIAPERGLHGTVPIVAATIPISVGAALAAKLQGSAGLSMAFFGDGATEEGVFHESMNLAASQELPVVFVCENNLFASHLHIRLRQPADGLSRYAQAHRIPFAQIDGNDLAAVHRAALDAATRARNGGGPTFIEMVTYRWRGHVGPREDIDVGVAREKDLALFKARDPIARLASALETNGGLGAGQLEKLALKNS